MGKPVSYLLAIIEIIGIVLILWLIPSETSTQIIIKTAVGLVWLFLFFFFRKKYNKK